MVEATLRYKDGARHRQSLTARGDDNGVAEDLLAAKAAMVVGTATSARESTALDPADYDLHASTGYSNAVFTFEDVTTDPLNPVTENVEVRDVTLAVLNDTTSDSSIKLTHALVTAFATAWKAAEAGRANFTLTSARFLNN